MYILYKAMHVCILINKAQLPHHIQMLRQVLALLIYSYMHKHMSS